MRRTVAIFNYLYPLHSGNVLLGVLHLSLRTKEKLKSSRKEQIGIKYSMPGLTVSTAITCPNMV